MDGPGCLRFDLRIHVITMGGWTWSCFAVRSMPASVTHVVPLCWVVATDLVGIPIDVDLDQRPMCTVSSLFACEDFQNWTLSR